jgi:hypothetical protein
MAEFKVSKDGSRVTVNGVEMNSRTFKKLYKPTSSVPRGGSGKATPKTGVNAPKYISDNPDAPKASVKKQTKKEAKAEAKTSKRAAKTVKKVNAITKKQAVKERNDWVKDTARKAAADRANKVAPEKRTAAEKRARSTATRWKNQTPGYRTMRGGAGLGGMFGVKNR